MKYWRVDGLFAMVEAYGVLPRYIEKRSVAMRKSPVLIAFIKLFTAAAVFVVLVPNIPVDYIGITDASSSETVVAASPMIGGNAFTTEYIHSVQLTPVIDEYRILQGRIWGWEERVQSHNAGLPFDAPKRGRFVMDPPWMIVRGDGINTDRIAYRVGTADLGNNKWFLPPFEEIKAYERFPSKRVFITSGIRRLASAPVIGLSLQAEDVNKK